VKSLVLSTTLLLLPACCIAPGFVETQRAFYDVVAPSYRVYVERDVALSEAQKERRYALLAAEEAAIAEAEASQ